jgi:hypothetical protein
MRPHPALHQNLHDGETRELGGVPPKEVQDRNDSMRKRLSMQLPSAPQTVGAMAMAKSGVRAASPKTPHSPRRSFIAFAGAFDSAHRSSALSRH